MSPLESSQTAPPGALTLPARGLGRYLAACLLTLVTGAATVLVGVPSADASITRLCEGYKSCRQAGMKNFGYAKNSGTMWWRMYTGHNCTNYAAYRLVKRGMSTERPWSGSGNASNWGHAMDHITDKRPRVGSIAWWKAYAPGAGSSGHVAYVQKVISPTEIIVSQDSWGGDFSWARITTDGSGWPTGFIHFKDVPLTNKVRPTVEGTPQIGETLSTTGGSWQPKDPDLAFQWKVGGVAVSGATSGSYTVREADRGKRIAVTVRATKVGYPNAVATSAATEPVLPGEMTATTTPAISGTPAVESTLTGVAPTWNVRPDAVSYQWLAAGKPIPQATGLSFVPTTEQVDKRIRLRATATRQGYDPVTVTSPATAPVAEGTLVRSSEPVIGGRPRIGRPLTLDPGTVSPEATVAVQWLRNGQPVPGATAATYAPVAEDLSARLSAQVTHSRAGFATITTVTPRTGRVKSPSALDARPRVGRRGVLRIRVAATAPSVVPVTGDLVLRKGRRTLQRVTLVDGRATFRVAGLRRGKHRLVVRLPVSPTVTTSRAVLHIEIP